MDIGAAVGGRIGVDARKLQAVAAAVVPQGVLDELETLAVQLADAMTATPANVPPTLFGALQARLSAPQLVELASAIAWEQYRSRYNRVFDIGAAGLATGAFCLVPARTP